uniref:Rab-GAP TBC domain-containing protein n=1 Tax=Macrostomum lignano TaxID=282301 RepID=A0A1I8F9M9_9PLAT
TPSASASNGVLLRKKNSIRKEWKRSPSISNSYADEWERMFLSHGEGDLLLYLKELCCSGELRNCRFRSVVWRLALRVLSSDAAKWKEETQVCLSALLKSPGVGRRSRYSELKQQHCIDISKLKRSPTASNLTVRCAQSACRSQAAEHPWYRLLSAGQPQPGHAEVLAPLLFVLHSDQLAFQSNACELYSATRPPVMRGWLIMRVIEPWYTRGRELEPPAGQAGAIESPGPVRQAPPKIATATPLWRSWPTIGERILRVHDLELYLPRLEKLEVAPHLYGIRWMRLACLAGNSLCRTPA